MTTYIPKSIDNNKRVGIFTSDNKRICIISENHKSSVIQGEQVFITTSDGSIKIYTVFGKYMRKV